MKLIENRVDFVFVFVLQYFCTDEETKFERQKSMNTTVTFEQTLETFIKSDEFAEAVIKSTKAGFGGSSYKVELFPDGTWRVLWANEIGNRYDTQGTIETIPALSDNDYQAFEEMTETVDVVDNTNVLAAALRNTDELEKIAQQMRDNL